MSRFHLLLADRETGEPVLPDGLEHDTREEKREEPTHLGDRGRDRHDLRRQGWAVIVPEGERGDQLIALLQPLIARRAAQLHCNAQDVPVYRCPPTLTNAQAAQWSKKHIDRPDVPLSQVPFYLLLAGDLDEVPLELQQSLAVDKYVGRLCFPSDDGYRAYVEKVEQHEDGGPQPPGIPTRVAIHTAHDRSSATGIGYEALARPLLRDLPDQSSILDNRTLVDELGRDERRASDLLAAVRSPSATAMLTICHGTGVPIGKFDEAEQRAWQGEVVLSKGQTLTAQDVGNHTFLPRGVWHLGACFGAGTPVRSTFEPWLRTLANAGAHRGDPRTVLLHLAPERPFVAALPQAALANLDGPLAVIGHVDLAWTHSMEEYDRADDTTLVTKRHGRYMTLLEHLSRGDRVGAAFQALYGDVGKVSDQVASATTDARGGGPDDPIYQGYRNMLREDIRGFIVLGDPAVHMPKVQVPARQVTRRTGLPKAPVHALPDVEKLEEAIAEVVLGERGVKAIARDLGVDHTQLEAWAKAYRAAGIAALR